MRIVTSLRRSLLEQRGHLFCWVPVCLALGIGLYFGVPEEPPRALIWLAGAVGCAMAGCAWGREPDVAAFVWVLALFCGGFALAGARAHHVASPVLDWRYYGPIEGQVVKIDRSARHAERLTLASVRLGDVPPHKTPRKVRVALYGKEPGVVPKLGMVVGTTGHLSPPSGPVEPNGFDFQRHAWFLGLGAVGYTRAPVVQLLPQVSGGGIDGFRMQLSQAIQSRVPADVAGVAAAITTGDRSAIPPEVTEALRGANLAHLLAISGLHMGLLAGFTFAVVRIGLALIPFLALRINGKRVAAAVALTAATAYLLLSGGSVSTERAFVMTAVVLVAVMLERRALTLRAVAVAAIVVLILQPEALLSPGFQMSFAATAALVGFFGMVRDHEVSLGPKWCRPVVSVVLSSLVAGAATAPFAAMHFNLVAHYGLLANVVSVPVMGIVVMPSAVMAAILAPLGLEGGPLWVMTQGLRWILAVAEFVSTLDGARGAVKSGGPWVLPLLSLGAIFVLLWQGRARWCGLGLVAVGMALWVGQSRPVVLVSDTGGLLGVWHEDTRVLSKATGQGFVARNWLENDGSIATQTEAAALWQQGQKVAGIGPVYHVSGKRGLAAFDGCKAGEFVVFSVPYDQDIACDFLDPKTLNSTGSIALYVTKSGVKRKTARQVAGRRLWNDTGIRQRQLGTFPAHQ